jgi:hypothetical protein
MNHPYRTPTITRIRDARLEQAILDGQNEQLKRIEEDKQYIEKYIEKFVEEKLFIDIKKAISIGLTEWHYNDMITPHNSMKKYERLKFAASLMENIAGLKAKICSTEGNECIASTPYLKVSW